VSVTRLAWVIGQPIKHSLSPAMHNAGFGALGIDARYEAREVAPSEVGTVVAEMRQPHLLGANVTAPHKQAVMAFLDHLDEEASRLGVVNTIVNREGILHGTNTDAVGLATWMQRAGVPVEEQDTVVFGAGGAGRATVVALTRLGARSILVLNRTLVRAEELIADLRPHVGGTQLTAGTLDRALQPLAADEQPPTVLVNATSLSHHGETLPVHPTWYAHPTCLAVDLAYNPPLTPFMLEARAAGGRAEDGLGMLVYQAVAAFEAWTGQLPDAIEFERAALEALATRERALARAIVIQGTEA
jgi:shikimate dehydrogenase